MNKLNEKLKELFDREDEFLGGWETKKAVLMINDIEAKTGICLKEIEEQLDIMTIESIDRCEKHCEFMKIQTDKCERWIEEHGDDIDLW